MASTHHLMSRRRLILSFLGQNGEICASLDATFSVPCGLPMPNKDDAFVC